MEELSELDLLIMGIGEEFDEDTSRPSTSSGIMPSTTLARVETEPKCEPEQVYSDEIFNNGILHDFSKYRRANVDPKELERLSFHQFEITYNSNCILIFGITDAGSSICCRVVGYKPYLYFEVGKCWLPGDMAFATQMLNNEFTKYMNSSSQFSYNSDKKHITSVEIVKKKSIMYYNGNNELDTFLKITLETTYALFKFRNFVKDTYKCMFGEFNLHLATVFEADIDNTLRFMCDTDITGCSWLELTKWKKIEQGVYPNRNGGCACQINVEVYYRDLISHPATGVWSRIAPFRILSFDIECISRQGIFPQPEVDQVIQISNMVFLQGNDEPFIKNVFVMKSCRPVEGIDILSFDNEIDMLTSWQKFFVAVDPDILTGYNILGFDIPYLLKRANALNVKHFSRLTRIETEDCVVTEKPFFSKQMGNKTLVYVNLIGRVVFDLFPVMIRDYKLRSYSLNSVSFHFLKEKKEDVHYSRITPMHNKNSETRSVLAKYCAKDALLPIKLLNKLMCLVNYIEMARVTGVPLSYILMRGQQIKVFSQILRKANSQNYVIPDVKINKQNSNDKYEGATVIEPMRGLYRDPIATLDFASLYPSIMIAHNLCYTTLVRPGNEKNIGKMGLTEDDVGRTPFLNNVFVKPHVHKGLLPEILENLLEARKRAKQDLKNEKDPFIRSVLDGRQLALKISANSVYGFTGAQIGKLPCIPISAGVTAHGRNMIDKTAKYVTTFYPESTVIYGDTDSVMINFGKIPRDQAMKIGKEAAERISNEFCSPIKLEFEKVYHPFLLVNKKRYAGLLYTNPDKHDKLECKGEFVTK